jgi:hypothetical protein
MFCACLIFRNQKMLNCLAQAVYPFLTFSLSVFLSLSPSLSLSLSLSLPLSLSLSLSLPLSLSLSLYLSLSLSLSLRSIASCGSRVSYSSPVVYYEADSSSDKENVNVCMLAALRLRTFQYGSCYCTNSDGTYGTVQYSSVQYSIV